MTTPWDSRLSGQSRQILLIMPYGGRADVTSATFTYGGGPTTGITEIIAPPGVCHTAVSTIMSGLSEKWFQEQMTVVGK